MDSKEKAQKLESLQTEKLSAYDQLDKLQQEYESLKNQDQVKYNLELKAEIDNIYEYYKGAVNSYEALIDLEVTTGKKYEDLQTKFAGALNALSERNYNEAEKLLHDLRAGIQEQNSAYLASLTPTPNPETTIDTSETTVNNTPPSAGYSRQTVATSIGNYTVSIIAGDLGSTRVLVDTASDSDCSNDCPVLSLADYVNRNGGYAGVNGTYFCPASYPSCTGKTNSFDLLVMNHKNTYFNSSNNVYSNNPAVIFGDGYVRFVTAASQWGRDTSPTGVLSNYPLLVFNSTVSFQGDGDPKKGSKGNRSFVAQKDNTVYIGVVHNVTVAESAIVLQNMGMQNALNLDSGGSTALYNGGYKLGPGRNVPNAIVFVAK